MRAVIEVVAETACTLGEGPIWQPDEEALYWVDIVGRGVFRHDPATGATDRYPVDDEVSVIGLWSGASWIAAGRRGVYRLDLPSGRIDMIGAPEPDDPESRFNDGKVDAGGRFWAGTMTADDARSTLYRVDTDHDIQAVDGPFTICNGIGWDPTGSTMYLVDSMRYVIHRYEFDAPSGSIANRQDLIVFEPADGIPDGLTVDQDGDLWCAMWGGSAVLRITPNGEVRDTVRLPVNQPSSCVFGGPSYDVLYVTSARQGLSAGHLAGEPLAGGLLAFRPGVTGRPEPRFGGNVDSLRAQRRP